jgi:hypothetical protein
LGVKGGPGEEWRRPASTRNISVNEGAEICGLYLATNDLELEERARNEILLLYKHHRSRRIRI